MILKMLTNAIFFLFLDNIQEISAGASRGCHLGDQLFPPGARWHPYLPPNGFDSCAICSCNVSVKIFPVEKEVCKINLRFFFILYM